MSIRDPVMLISELEHKEETNVFNNYDGKFIAKKIEKHIPAAQLMKRKYSRYRATKEGVPIFTRVMPNDQKVDNKINHDWMGEVVDLKVGVFTGIKIVNNLDKDQLNFEQIHKRKRLFMKINNVAELDARSTKYAAICGYAARYVYIGEYDSKPAVRVMHVDPWETIFLKNAVEEVTGAIRYYYVLDDKNKPYIKVEAFNKYCVTYWALRGNKIEFISEKEHYFGVVPWIEIANNDEYMGDCDKIFPLIDVYDRLLSDETSELEQFRLAYLALFGLSADSTELDKMRQTGAFQLTKDGKVEFITKDINDTAYNNLLRQIEKNIVRFGKSVDFSEKDFSEKLSNLQIKFKTFALENKCITLERKFEAALTQQWRLVSKIWEKYGFALDYLLMEFRFTRNIPRNEQEDATVQATLVNSMSDETRLAQHPAVSDPHEEMAKMAAEQEKKMTDPWEND